MNRLSTQKLFSQVPQGRGKPPLVSSGCVTCSRKACLANRSVAHPAEASLQEPYLDLLYSLERRAAVK
ncbi:MAG: hypothetical protein U0V48_15025 [Anaerolineales bacterium]